MRKVISILLVLAACIAMTACGSTENSSNSVNNVTETQAAESNASAEPSDSDSEAPKSQASSAAKADYTVKDYVVVDNDTCIFKINEVKDKKGSVEFSVYCENKTEETTLMFSVDNCAVNGCSIEPLWANSVAAGKKANDSIGFSAQELKLYGIETVDEFRFDLSVYDYDNWSAEKAVEDTFVVYPTGKNGEEVTYPRRGVTGSDIVFVDNDDMKVVITESGKGTFWAFYSTLYLENKTDNTLMFSWGDVSVNGFMCDPFFATTVPAHSCKYTDVTFSTTAFEENSIEEVEEIEFGLHVYDADSWLSEYLNDTFTYNP